MSRVFRGFAYGHDIRRHVAAVPFTLTTVREMPPHVLDARSFFNFGSGLRSSIRECRETQHPQRFVSSFPSILEQRNRDFASVYKRFCCMRRRFFLFVNFRSPFVRMSLRRAFNVFLFASISDVRSIAEHRAVVTATRRKRNGRPLHLHWLLRSFLATRIFHTLALSRSRIGTRARHPLSETFS